MFGRVFLAQLKVGLRSKQYLFWTAFFPLALGTLFSFAFKTIYSSEQTKTIPVAVIVEFRNRRVQGYGSLFGTGRKFTGR